MELEQLVQVFKRKMQLKKNGFIFLLIFIQFLFLPSWSQTSPAPTPEIDPALQYEEASEGGGNVVKLLTAEPNRRRIKRHLNLIAGIKHDEEILIPEIPLNFKGEITLIDIQRIKGTDVFRILPQKVGNGIVTVHNKKTGQILIELRIDVRDQTVEKSLREVKALLADIEGVEYKIVNGKILLDGFVLLPKDLKRIGSVIGQFAEGGVNVTSLVTLSPIARQKIVEYISRDINNPEISVTPIGDYIRLEGFVNSIAEKTRVSDVVSLYLPDIVRPKGEENLKNIEINGRRAATGVDGYIINNIQVREDKDKVEPPPKMIQVVIHIVEYSERYLKEFSFVFSPSLTGLGTASAQTRAPTSIGEIASIVDNLLPKLNWARTHGYIRLLDTASILTQNSSPASLNRSIAINQGNTTAQVPGQPAAAPPPPQVNYELSMNTTPVIKSERSGLIELQGLNVTTKAGGNSLSPSTTINTTVSVRDRQSAALAGIISKKTSNEYGGPTGAGAYITLNHGKSYEKGTSNFVLFVTPIIKSSASSGVEQVKKKFRMKE